MTQTKNLLKIYSEVFEKSNDWNFYSNMDINPFNNEYNAKNFVKRFIELSGKAEDNPLYDYIIKLDKIRIRHIVSTFFLGIYLYSNIQKIKSSINKVVNRYKKQISDSVIEFSFMWYLICLFHDLGYSIEDNEKYEDFKIFIKNKQIIHSLKRPVGVPALYKDVYKDYFNYRLGSINSDICKPDHGICGGIILFNALNEILIKNQNAQKPKKLSWNPKLINLYNYVSWVILAHNIYFIRKGDKFEKCYRDKNLDKLILNEGEISKISLKKHSFLFLFALVDTIEPIKVLNEFTNLEKLKCKVELNNAKSCIISLELDDEKLRACYFDKVYDLKKWLLPEINLKNNVLEITL